MSLSAATNGGCSCLRPSELTISGVAWRMPWISSEVLFKLAQQTMFDDFWDFWRSKSCSNHEWWKLYTVEFHLYTFEKKIANNGHVSVTDPSPSSLNYNHLCNTTRSLFHALWWELSRAMLLSYWNASGFGAATLRNPASRQDLKNGRLLLGRSSPSWLMEWGSWIRRNDNWNRTLMKQMIFQYIS